MAADELVPIGDGQGLERYADLGDGTYVQPSAISPQVVILGKRKVGAIRSAKPAPGWSWAAGQWMLDGLPIAGQTNPKAYTNLSTDVGKILGFLPTSPLMVGYGGQTEVGTPDAPASLVLTSISGGVSGAFPLVADANNGGSVITKYRIRLSDGSTAEGVSSPILVATQSLEPVTGQVNAVTAAGDGDKSPISNAVIPGAAIIPSIQSQSSAVGGSSVSSVSL